MKATWVCTLRKEGVILDVFRVGLLTGNTPKVVRYSGALRTSDVPRAHPPDEKKTWLRSIKQVAELFGMLDGILQWAPGEEPDAQCSACEWRFWSGTGHPNLAICRDCVG